MVQEFAELGLVIRSDQAERATRRLKELGVEGVRVEQRMGRVERRAGLVNRRMAAMAASLVSVAAAFRAVRAAREFERSLAEIRSLGGETVESIQQIRSELINLSRETAQPLTELTQALFAIESAGFAGADALRTLRESARLGVAGFAGTGVAAEAVLAIQAGFARPAAQVQETADQLLAAAQASAATLGDFASVVGQVASIAAAASVDLDEMLAAMAAISNITRDVRLASVQTRALIVQLQRLGLTEEIRRRGLLEVTREVKQQAEEAGQPLIKLLGEIRAVAAAENLLANESAEYNRILQRVRESQDAVNKSYEEAADTADFKLSQATENLNKLWIVLGERMVRFTEGPVRQLLDQLSTPEELATGQGRLAAEDQLARMTEEFNRRLGEMQESLGRGATDEQQFTIALLQLRQEFIRDLRAAERDAAQQLKELEDLLAQSPTGENRRALLEGRENIKANIGDLREVVRVFQAALDDVRRGDLLLTPEERARADRVRGGPRPAGGDDEGGGSGGSGGADERAALQRLRRDLELEEQFITAQTEAERELVQIERDKIAMIQQLNELKETGKLKDEEILEVQQMIFDLAALRRGAIEEEADVISDELTPAMQRLLEEARRQQFFFDDLGRAVGDAFLEGIDAIGQLNDRIRELEERGRIAQAIFLRLLSTIQQIVLRELVAQPIADAVSSFARGLARSPGDIPAPGVGPGAENIGPEQLGLTTINPQIASIPQKASPTSSTTTINVIVNGARDADSFRKSMPQIENELRRRVRRLR